MSAQVNRARWEAFTRSSDRALDPEYQVFLNDLVRPYGLALRPDVKGGHSYGEMLAGLIGEVVPADQAADALILGFAMPDVWPGRATATYLSHVCPGDPMAFAVCDQGCATGFTALRLARDYASSGWPRVLVALAEQARLDYDPPAPASVPSGHAAFVMLCEAGPPAAGSASAPRPEAQANQMPRPEAQANQILRLRAVRVCPGVSAGQVPAALGGELAALGDDASLILGEGLAPLASHGWPDALAVPAGQPVTGVWRELAEWAAAPRDTAAPDGDGLVLADYDPALGYLCLAAFTKTA